MSKSRARLGAQGAVGEAFYVNTPICCPSRTEYDTSGQRSNLPIECAEFTLAEQSRLIAFLVSQIYLWPD
eukprot:SAG31_NODE_28248_length_413_cov_0.789809_2_plen_69_part_01